MNDLEFGTVTTAGNTDNALVINARGVGGWINDDTIRQDQENDTRRTEGLRIRMGIGADNSPLLDTGNDKEDIKAAEKIMTQLKTGTKIKVANVVKLKADISRKIADYVEIGQTHIADQLETEFKSAVSRAQMKSKGYDTFVTRDQIVEYSAKLPWGLRLIEQPVKEYRKPIPGDVVTKIKDAQKTKLFESFIVVSVQRVPDPIVFGIAKGDANTLYFIGEWGDDITIADIINSD